MLLGVITSNINAHHGQMVNSVVAYRTVFGCDYHVLTHTTLNKARKCKTVHDLVTHINDDGHFAKYVEEYYGADDSVFTPSSDNKRRMSSNLYWEKNDSKEDIASEDWMLSTRQMTMFCVMSLCLEKQSDLHSTLVIVHRNQY